MTYILIYKGRRHLQKARLRHTRFAGHGKVKVRVSNFGVSENASVPDSRLMISWVEQAPLSTPALESILAAVWKKGGLRGDYDSDLFMFDRNICFDGASG